jgi:hypothetical protein
MTQGEIGVPSTAIYRRRSSICAFTLIQPLGGKIAAIKDDDRLQMLHNTFHLETNWDATDFQAAGEQPAFGRVKHWIERRLSPRREVNISVLVLQASSVQSAILCNRSEAGFGLSKVSNIALDELISITMPDGRVLEGRVAWAKDSRAGVALMSRS